MSEMHRYLKQMKNNPQTAYVLATVTSVEGSSYRKKGAKMLFSVKEETGLVSGGCVEEDLSYAAAEVMETGKAKQMSYDLRSEDDLGWGAGAGCNGCIYVYLQKFRWEEDSTLLQPVLEEMNASRAVQGVTRFGEAPAYFTADGEMLSGKLIFSEEEQKMFEQLRRAKENTAYVDKEETLLFERFEPQEKLYIFGAGRDVEPLVHQAARLHFEVKVVDPRESRCQPEYFPDAQELICSHPDTFLQEKKLEPGSYVLIMTHSFERDQLILKHVASQEENLSYVGVLGPLRRTRRLLGSAAVPNWLHAPVGLSIEAEGAEEIAVSIAAELIQARRKKEAETVSERAVM